MRRTLQLHNFNQVKRLLLILLIASSFISKAQDQILKYFALGADSVLMATDIFYPHPKGVYFINLHEDENTSLNAGLKYVIQRGGHLNYLRQNQKRTIQFTLNKRLHQFDPNRIFTPKGIKSTLLKHHSYTKQAEEIVQQLADSILGQLPQPKLIIALHNNGNNQFSILSYLKGGSEVKNAAEVYINPDMDVDDFILTTEKYIFDFLVNTKINVVLQNNEQCIDDGSLSVYCGKHNIPYINVEAEIGHITVQQQMIFALSALMDYYSKK